MDGVKRVAQCCSERVTIQQAQTEIEEEFELFDDWMQKYEHLIELQRPAADLRRAQGR